MARKRKLSHPAAAFIVLRPIPSAMWKRAVKAAARKRGISAGAYCIKAIESAMRRDGVAFERKPAGKAALADAAPVAIAAAAPV